MNRIDKQNKLYTKLTATFDEKEQFTLLNKLLDLVEDNSTETDKVEQIEAEIRDWDMKPSNMPHCLTLFTEWRIDRKDLSSLFCLLRKNEIYLAKKEVLEDE